MSAFIDRLTDYCLINGIVAEEDIPWFKYGLGKRISTLIVAIPFFVLSVLLSDIYAALAFYFCFYILRSRTNGYHAKSIMACFVLSLLHVAVILGLLYPVLNQLAVCIVSVLSTTLIWFLAPFNHPDIHLTTKEMIANRISSRIRSGSMMLASVVACALGGTEIAKGISLGIAMAAYLLCLAYILNGGTNYGKNTRKDQKNS